MRFVQIVFGTSALDDFVSPRIIRGHLPEKQSGYRTSENDHHCSESYFVMIAHFRRLKGLLAKLPGEEARQMSLDDE